MRLAPPRLAVPIIVLTLAVAGCGGATVTVQEVPGDPVELTVPGTATALAPTATATPTATPTATADAERRRRPRRRPTPAPATRPTQTAPEGTTGGGTDGARRPTDTATTDQPPPAGSDAEQFEDFCAENPGAC